MCPALVALVLSCSSGGGSTGAKLAVSVKFPADSGLKARYIDPRTGCIQLSLNSPDGSFSKTALLTPSSPSAFFTGLPEDLIMTVRSTDGSQTQGACGGNIVDYVSVRLSLKPGTNSLSITMPRATWNFDSPITLSGGETLSGISLTPVQDNPIYDGFSTYRLSVFGSNLYDCGTGFGTVCYANTDYYVDFQGPGTTRGSIGSEFVPFPSPSRGWVRLSSAGGVERYAVFVGTLPCAVKREKNLRSCIFNVSQDLSPYVGMKTSGSSISGYLWEVFVNNNSTGLSCAWNLSFTDPITTGCPDGLSVGALSKASLDGVSSSDTGGVLRAKATFQNLSASLTKVFSHESKDYALCDTNDPARCDYNLDGVIDQGDDTNGDGRIDASDSRTFFSKSEWNMNFDLITYPLSAQPTQETDPVQPHLFVSSQSFQSGPSLGTVTPLGPYGNQKGSSPPSMDVSAASFLLWGYGAYDVNGDTYSSYLSRWFILYDMVSESLLKIDAFDPDFSSGTTLGTLTGGLCYLKSVVDPYISTAYIFVLGAGQDSSCGTPDDTTAFIDTNRGVVSTGVPFIDTSTSSISGVLTFSSRQDRAITGFLGLDVNKVELLRCDLDMNCTPTGIIGVSSFKPVGYLRSAQMSFGIIDMASSNSLVYYDVQSDTPTALPTPVDDCVLDNYTLFCYSISGGGATVYRFDMTTRNLVPIGTLSGVTSVYYMGTTANNVVLSYYGPPDAVAYVRKDGTSSGVVSFGTGSPILSMFSDEGAYGYDSLNSEFCYMLDTSPGGGTCLSNSRLVMSGDEPLGTYPGNGLLSDIRFRAMNYVYVVEGCTVSGSNCVGGVLYRYNTSLDLSSREKVMDIPAGLEAGAVYGSDDLFLVSVTDPASSQNYVYFVRYDPAQQPVVSQPITGYIVGSSPVGFTP
ncbi:hypothetical protein [Hydrogenivirga sp.]